MSPLRLARPQRPSHRDGIHDQPQALPLFVSGRAQDVAVPHLQSQERDARHAAAEGLILPAKTWEKAETSEMENVVELYGKAYHLWQVDRRDKLPMGAPELTSSYTAEGLGGFNFKKDVVESDQRLSGKMEWPARRAARERIKDLEIHQDADQTWKKSNDQGGKAGSTSTIMAIWAKNEGKETLGV